MLIYFVILLIAPSLARPTKCEQIRALGRKPTIDDIKSMKPSEVVICLSYLAQEPMNIIEADCVWHVLVNLYEGVDNIPDRVLAELHWVTPAIRHEDYANISMDTIEVVRNFGLNYSLDLTILTVIADRVREGFSGKTPEDYTFYDLKALNYILCGFNRTDIERIHPSVYKQSAFIVGKLKNCNPEVMQGFVTLIQHKDAFGPAKYWSALIVKVIGCVVEYLPPDLRKKVKMTKKTADERIDYLDDITDFDNRIIYALEKH